METIKTNKGNKGNNNETSNGISAAMLKDIRKDIHNYKDSFRNACLILLEVAKENTNVKKLNAFLGLTAEAVKNKNISETRKRILSMIPYYYCIEGSDTHFPAKLIKVNSRMVEAGVREGYFAKKDSYINALLTIGVMLSRNAIREPAQLSLTSSSESVEDMNFENTSCVIYTKNGNKLCNATEAYIKYKQAAKRAKDNAKIEECNLFSQVLKNIM